MNGYTIHTETGDSEWDGKPATVAQAEASSAEKTGSGIIRIVAATGAVVADGAYRFADAIRVFVARYGLNRPIAYLINHPFIFDVYPVAYSELGDSRHLIFARAFHQSVHLFVTNGQYWPSDAPVNSITSSSL